MPRPRRPEGFLRSQWRRIYWIGLPLASCGIAVALADLSVAGVERLSQLEGERVEDLYLYRAVPANPAIVTIGFDSKSKERLPKWEDGSLSRSNYAQLIRKLRRAGAKALFIDLVFDVPKGIDDVALHQALHEGGTMPISLASVYQEEDSDEPVFVELDHLGVRPSGDPLRATANTAFAVISNAIGGVVVEWDPPRQRDLLHSALSVVLQFRGIPEREIRFDRKTHELRAGGMEWSLNGNDAVFVNWTDEARPFRRYDLATLLLEATDAQLAEAFRGRLVLVGTREAGVDIVPTGKGVLFGVDFHAQLANTMLLSPSDRIRDVDTAWHFTWCVILGTGAALAGLSRRFFWTAFGLGSLLVLATMGPVLLIRMAPALLETVAPVLTVVFAFGIGSAVRGLASAPGRPAGSEFEATAMFVDLKGSTELLQRLGPQAFRRVYSEFSAQIARVAKQFGGDVERTTGDGALLIFVAERRPHHAVAAAEAIPPMIEAVHALGLRQGLDLDVTVGMESGLLTGGYVAEGGHRAWSSAGTAVNLAKRLQDSAAELEKNVLMGPAAARLVEGHRAVEKVGEIVAQGFEGTVAVWSPVEGE